MTDSAPRFDPSRKNPNTVLELSEAEIETILGQLRRKEGNWINWGQLCRQLHRAQCDPREIFEETGIEASVQNQTSVAAQVYESAIAEDISDRAKAYCEGPHSDVLYELRVLNQIDRARAAEYAAEKNLDVDGGHLLARAMKATARTTTMPAEFTDRPGDAIAYQCWQQARRKKDLQDRSKAIAQGFKYVESDTARKALEELLTDFSVVPTAKAPLLPFYRVDVEEEMPRLIPFAGESPLSVAELAAAPALPAIEPFQVVEFPAGGRGVPVPGWASVIGAIDPVSYTDSTDSLPNTVDMKTETVLVVVDRAVRDWSLSHYFAIEREGRVEVQWFDRDPGLEPLGKVILILRPKRILDEGNITEPWQMDD
ncbi:MAG: RuBisCO accumulation factor 1 [Geitlerinemataceae cyanobacterium]